MYIEVQKTKTNEYIFLRSSTRDKKTGKIIKKTLANLTHESPDQVMKLVNALRADQCINPKDLKQGKTIGFSLVIYFIMKLLNITTVLGKTYEAKIALVLLSARIFVQSSRLQALFWAEDSDHILDVVGFSAYEKSKLDNKTIYYGLDYMQSNQEKIEDKLFKSYYKNNPPKRVFYDVTSSYVEGDYNNSELVTYGYNRDGKKGKAQIVIGLLTDVDGHAISIHTYRGNTNDVTTFIDRLDKLKNRFKLENITIVGDALGSPENGTFYGVGCGMIKSEDIAKIKELGYDYITSIGKPSIKKLIEDKSSKMNASLFDEKLQEFIENDTRYILRQNPIRRDEIRDTRESKIKRVQEFINLKKEYYNTHYRAKTETLERYIDKKISDLKLSSFISYNINYEDGDIAIKDKDGNFESKTKPLATIEIITDEKTKRELEKLDGCYCITTSLLDTDKNTKEDIHKAYKTLIKVENAFKTLKTDYLEIRPLYLKTDKRIKGHIALSMLAYNITLQLREYTKLCDLDFKSTIELLKSVKTQPVQLTKKISATYIPKVCDNLQKLFKIMDFSMPLRVNY